MMDRLLLLAALLALAGAAGAQSDKPRGRGQPEDVGGIPEEKPWQEDVLKLPPWPQDARLAEFVPRGSSGNTYSIDLDSISIGDDRVVRYTTVIRTRSGTANVSYEGLRCKDSTYKVYAFGTPDNAWRTARDPKWQPVGVTAGNFRFSLKKDYFCNLEAIAGRNVRDLRQNVQSAFPQKSNTTVR